MPNVDLVPVPNKPEELNSYLFTNFRRVQDSLALAAGRLGSLDIEITDPNQGIILTAPNLNRYRITVGNTGVLTTTLVP